MSTQYMTTNYMNHYPTAHQMTTSHNQTANYYQTQPIQAQVPQQTPQVPLVNTIRDIHTIRHQLICPNLTNYEALSMARDALLYGVYGSTLHIFGELCHQFIHQNMIFVLSEGFDSVVTIIWDTKDNQIVGNQSLSTFQPHTISANTNTNIRNQQIFTPYLNNNNRKTQSISIPVTPIKDDYDCMIDEHCIDEIVTHLDQDMNEQDAYASMPLDPYRQHTIMSSVSVSSSSDSHKSHSLPDIKISDALFLELNIRLFGNKLKNKQELSTHIQSAIHANKIATQYISADNHDFCVWIDSFYVYCTLKDESTLCDIFDYNQFHNQYNQCYESLIKRVTEQQQQQQQQYTPSRRSVFTDSSSKRSVFTDISNVSEDKKRGDYHTIYLKPIIERMKANTLGSNVTVSTDFIIEIVDNSIKYGVKRQISKRTFEFKWNSYTIIMSKSLKTILDVTVSADANVVTVHPDVVSIISKKCPILDYVTIQKLAKKAKIYSSFTTKKNDYRQQFIYDAFGCRIVFASNHTTIVEMQCNVAAALNEAVMKL